jgi:elongation factor P
MATANELKKGIVINYEGALCQVFGAPDHVKPGKGGAFYQTKLKNLDTGSIVEVRFRSEDKIDVVYVENRDATFLYDSGSEIEVMYADTFEQIGIPHHVIGERRVFLVEGMKLEIVIAGEKIINISMPQSVDAIVAEAEPYIKGQTASGSFKPAVLENGLRIMVPQFIETGEKVRVNTETLEYMERSK